MEPVEARALGAQTFYTIRDYMLGMWVPQDKLLVRQAPKFFAMRMLRNC